MSKQQSRALAKIVPYAIVVLSIISEGALVDFIVRVLASDWLGVPRFGSWLAWILFIIGGFAIGLLELRIIHRGEDIRDPLMQFCCWAQCHLHALGFVINALTLGSMGASIALKREGYTHAKTLSFIAAILYATVWIPIFIGAIHAT